MTFLKIESVSKTYPNADKPCIEKLDLEVNEGEIVVILGQSGCGKTTLLKMIAGLEQCDSGTISLNDEVINSIPPYKRPISMVFQKPLLFKNLTVEDNINFSPRIKGTMSKEEMHEEVLKLLELIELEGYGDRKANQLSGGQEQRVSLARALMTKPKLLLLDEPFSALDAKLRVSMRDSLRRICKSIGQTVIFVTHDQQEAVALGDRLALMMDGKILQYGNPNMFYHRPNSKSSAMFFGWENAIPAVQDGSMVTCPLGEFMFPDVEPKKGDVLLMVHPQAAMCTPQGKYVGKVKEAVYLGTISNYTVDCNGVELKLQVSCRNMHLVGEDIRFNIDLTMIWPVEDEPKPEPKPVVQKTKNGLLSRFKISKKRSEEE